MKVGHLSRTANRGNQTNSASTKEISKRALNQKETFFKTECSLHLHNTLYSTFPTCIHMPPELLGENDSFVLRNKPKNFTVLRPAHHFLCISSVSVRNGHEMHANCVCVPGSTGRNGGKGTTLLSYTNPWGVE